MRRSRVISIIFIAISIGGASYGFFCHRLFYHDDAFISLRYVYNFLHGQGLVWNPGERVEGYSSFLMVMLTSILGRLGLDLHTATRAIGVASFVAIVVVTWLWSRRLCQNHAQETSLVAPMLTATALPLIAWSLGGLETTLFTFLLLMGWWAVVRAVEGDRQAAAVAGLAFGLASMTRPEGFFYVAMAAVFLGASAIRRRSTWAAVGWCVGVAALVYLPLLLWRISYYGDFVPNPVHAKGSLSLSKFLLGAKYVGTYVRALPLLLPLAVAAMIVAKVQKRWSQEITLLGLVVVTHLVFVMLVGGDHMPAFRFIVPIVPVLALLIGMGLTGLRRLVLTVAMTVVGLLAVGQLADPAGTVRAARIEDGAAFLGRIVGEWINTAFPQGSVVALNTAGSTPYYAPNLRFIDMLGINDRSIACRKNIPQIALFQWVPGHEKGDGAYILARRPHVIFAGGSIGYPINTRWFVSEYELAHMAEFDAEYELDGVMLTTTMYEGYKSYRESRPGEMPVRFYKRRVPSR